MKRSLVLIFIFFLFLFSACLQQPELKYTLSTYYKCSQIMQKNKEKYSKKALKARFKLCIAHYENIKKQKFE